MSLATKYRPNRFEDVCSQGSIIRILQQQLSTRKFTNCYLFVGPSGCGKTTLARIYANGVNNGVGEPIEIDGASNNGVDAVRAIIDSARERSIDSEYKIFIIDECHAISTQGWQAFLKCIEEPPKYTIFIFCTTNPEKIPSTILNRVMRFNLSKVDTALIRNRLAYICKNEGYTNYDESCDFIAKLSNGGARDAIAYLEKCANYSTDLNIDNTLACLGDFSYDSLFNLTGALLNQDEAEVLQTIETYYQAGNDLKLFIEKYLDFTLDLTKYCLFRSMECVKIPLSLQGRCDGYASVPDILPWTKNLVGSIMNIKNVIRYDTNNKTTIEALMLEICRN